MLGVNVEVGMDVIMNAMTADEKDELIESLVRAGYGSRTSRGVEDWIHRIKYLGLDTDLTALEVLERMRDGVAA